MKDTAQEHERNQEEHVKVLADGVEVRVQRLQALVGCPEIGQWHAAAPEGGMLKKMRLYAESTIIKEKRSHGIKKECVEIVQVNAASVSFLGNLNN